MFPTAPLHLPLIMIRWKNSALSGLDGGWTCGTATASLSTSAAVWHQGQDEGGFCLKLFRKGAVTTSVMLSRLHTDDRARLLVWLKELWLSFVPISFFFFLKNVLQIQQQPSQNRHPNALRRTT